MKKTKVMFVAALMGISLLAAGCSGEKTLSQSGQETRAQWGLNFYDGQKTEPEETEQAEQTEPIETEAVTEAATTEAFEAEVTVLDSGVKVTSMREKEVHALQMVNVRSGPGAGYKQLGVLSADEAVVATGTCDNGWIRVLYKDQEGFVSSRYLESIEQADSQTSAAESSAVETSAVETSVAETSAAESSAAAESQETSSQAAGEKKAWATQDVHVRSGPAASYELVGNLPKSGVVIVLDDSDPGWWKVDFDGREAYISTRYLTTDPAAAAGSAAESSQQESSRQESQAAAGKAWAVSAVNVHSGPGMNYGNIGVLSGGQEVDLLDSSSGWWKIRFNGRDGYVYRNYLTKTKP